MATNEAIDFMKAYALRGIDDWRGAADAVKTRARYLLPSRLAEHEYEAVATINSIRNGMKNTKFIPTPNTKPAGIAHSFFLPIRIDDERTAFDLLLLCDGDRCLGYRFEPADVEETTHCYGHIQMNRRMDGGSFAVEGLPAWAPDSYPAFPLRTSEPLEMFLSMATSIHGYHRGMGELLQNVIPAAGSRRYYEKRLQDAMK